MTRTQTFKKTAPHAAAARKTEPAVLATVGNTPLVKIEGVWVKMEHRNPSGSIKARIAAYMIEKAEKEGSLKPGDTIVEATSGNTGNALSMVAAAKGYKMLVIMPAGYTSERVTISRSFGAEIMEVGNFHVNEALEKARELGTQEGYYNPGQFDNEWNVDENREILGPEILAQLPEGVTPDALVMGVGTGGTLVGVGQAFRAVNPNVELYALEPNESCTLACGQIGKHQIEGISDGFVPGIYQRHGAMIDSQLPVGSHAAWVETGRLAREYGIMVGSSSGANLLAAKNLLRHRPDLNVVTFFCDEGEKYLSSLFAGNGS